MVLKKKPFVQFLEFISYCLNGECALPISDKSHILCGVCKITGNSKLQEENWFVQFMSYVSCFLHVQCPLINSDRITT